jgi:hypothetical protein
VADWAERIPKDPQIAALADKRARELVLALTLATAQFGLHFEQTYQVIFPSQIHTMRACNDGPVSMARLRTIYNQAMPPLNEPDPVYPFENLLGFLTNSAEFLTVSPPRHA